MRIEKIFLVKVFENSPLARLFGIYGLQNVSNIVVVSIVKKEGGVS